MGTSANYSAPANWGPIKSTVTRAGSSFTPTRMQGMVSSFVSGMRGAGRGGFGGGGGAAGGGAPGVAQGLGEFLSTVAESGLAAALRSVGLESLEGRGPEEIVLALLDVLCGPGSTIDAVDLRNALSALLEELLGGAATFAAAEQALGDQANSLEQVITNLFGNYIFERFQTTMYAGLEAKIGAAAVGCLESLRDYIRGQMQLEATRGDLTRLDWAGPPGAALVNDILERTFAVFSVP